MTQKQFIWLGIRVLGFYWLIKLIYAIFMVVWVMVFGLLSQTGATLHANYTATWIVCLFIFPIPLFLSAYFLFFGKQIYKFINHFVHNRPDDVLQAKGYSEVIIRFIGLWCIGLMINSLFKPFFISLQSATIVYYTHPESLRQGILATALQGYLNIASISSLAIYSILLIFFIWYFLKRGKLFIKLLYRLWRGKDQPQLLVQAQP